MIYDGSVLQDDPEETLRLAACWPDASESLKEVLKMQLFNIQPTGGKTPRVKLFSFRKQEDHIPLYTDFFSPRLHSSSFPDAGLLGNSLSFTDLHLFSVNLSWENRESIERREDREAYTGKKNTWALLQLL